MSERENSRMVFSRINHPLVVAMWQNMSRYILSIVLQIWLAGLVFGQEIEDSFTSKRLKGYKSITSVSIDNPSFYTILSIDSNGNIIKTENYGEGELKEWREFEYDAKGNLTYEERHSQIYVYNEEADDHLPIWEDGRYSGILYEYGNNKLVSVTYFYVNKDDFSNHLEIQYAYDKSGRLLKETHRNNFNGFTGNFKPNTSELDTIFLKNSAEIEEVDYTYINDTVIATRSNSGKVIEYTYKILDQNKQPVHVYRTDESRDKIVEYYYIYSKEGLLIEERMKVLNYDKLDIDMAAGDLVKTWYNSKGLPIETKAYENSTMISGSTYYYK